MFFVFVRFFGHDLDLPTSRASKAELGGRKIYTIQEKTGREATGSGAKAQLVSLAKNRIKDVILPGIFLGLSLLSGRSFSNLLSFSKRERNKLFPLNNLKII